MQLSALATGLEVYAVVVASLLGSFINLAADRLPRGESLVRPRSHCRGCGRILNVVDLIPVAGFVIRRGGCATCGVSIGLSSPLVEAACVVAMAAAIGFGGLYPGAVAGFAMVALIGSIRILLGFVRPTATREARSG